jgi:hypothetical protein
VGRLNAIHAVDRSSHITITFLAQTMRESVSLADSVRNHIDLLWALRNPTADRVRHTLAANHAV